MVANGGGITMRDVTQRGTRRRASTEQLLLVLNSILRSVMAHTHWFLVVQLSGMHNTRCIVRCIALVTSARRFKIPASVWQD